ncbi:hypothetical protein CU669_10760 [Paramagnetospirillum kuznetsovii]|uniref:Uncharacterized protein n=1 Tax=Paramagnetospirillum kuznetsovii TaxID=2053833 RepID=A0A364NYE6_9PROT|nr:hypothetical protein [Paramagnetospirillum kuznetsovii]RAU21937.1 hypothetical protein CU669_10760 [Paramagnetospirillum kuznetsovii]
MATRSAEAAPLPPPQTLDLAAHFMECGALNTNLSLAPGERLIITDDLLDGTVADFAAVSMAAIVARDGQVARAAIIPLSVAASKVKPGDRQKYERLFQLIEETAFDESVRESAEALIAANFRDSQIRELAAELGGTIGPARARYRTFLDVIKLLIDKKISEGGFLDEFLEFTRAVAGKLDFGIYSMCVDRMFVSENIPIMVKASLLGEIIKYPPLVRKELVTNLLSSPKAPRELVTHARNQLAAEMTRAQMTEIVLFTMLKQSWQWQKLAPGRPTI